MSYKYRMHDPRIGRFFAVDPLAAKYPSESPYSFVGNSPIANIENDGQDYAPYVNHETKTITIKATYYTECGDVDSYASALNATQFWNNESGNYQYKVGKGKEAVLYDIVFEFTVKEIDDAIKIFYIDRETDQEMIDYQKERGIEPMTTDGSSNFYVVQSDDSPVFSTKVVGEIINGVTRNGVIVQVKNSQKDSNTGAHEIGHTLGYDHEGFTIMSKAQNVDRSENINKRIVQRMLKNAGLGKKDVPEKYQSLSNGNLQVEESEASEPKDFEQGKIIKKK